MTTDIGVSTIDFRQYMAIYAYSFEGRNRRTGVVRFNLNP